MPTRWNTNSQDAADIFGAVHRGLLPAGGIGVLGETEVNRIIDEWLKAHSNLKEKYGGENFRNNFGRNFRKVVLRYEDWKKNRGKYMIRMMMML